MRRACRLLVPLACVLTLAASASAQPRSLAVIIDTSSSMKTSDPARYTVQLSQILSDLLDDGDDMTVVRMADSESCGDGPDRSLIIPVSTANRERSKEGLRGLRYDSGGTHFAAAVRTAADALRRFPDRPRMLLFLADSGGLGGCESVLTRDLVRLRDEGVMIAAANLGSTTGAFDRNPAFDFTVPALDARGLIESVGLVYQRFLGAKQVQSGSVDGDIEVEVAPYARRAYIVVAADGELGQLSAAPGNPAAASVDLHHRGGGHTNGLAGDSLLGQIWKDLTGRGSSVRREYRIVRLDRPAPGRWRFRASQLQAAGAWLLVQELTPIEARWLEPSGTVVVGRDTVGVVALFDGESGEPIDPAMLADPDLTVEVDGRRYTLRDDGTGADATAGDGRFSGLLRFEAGDSEAHLTFETATRSAVSSPLAVEVRDAAWELEAASPERVEVGRETHLSVRLGAIGDRGRLPPVDHVEAEVEGGQVILRDDGEGPDLRAGDDLFTGSWTPRTRGTHEVLFHAVVPNDAVRTATTAVIEVTGRLRLAAPPPIDLGSAAAGDLVTTTLDLSASDVEGDFELRVTSDLVLQRVAFEVEGDEGWRTLGRRPVTVRLGAAGGTRQLRLRVGSCPPHVPAGGSYRLILEANGVDGTVQRVETTVLLSVEQEPWIACWWPLLAIGAGLVALGVAFHGFWSPTRFPPRYGVVISQEEDVEEGFFYPLRHHRASRSGFYRNASIFVGSDYRLTGKASGAVARLRAEGTQVRVYPAPGMTLWRRTADGDWIEVPEEGITAFFGTLYRKDDGHLYFETRNG